MTEKGSGMKRRHKWVPGDHGDSRCSLCGLEKATVSGGRTGSRGTPMYWVVREIRGRLERELMHVVPECGGEGSDYYGAWREARAQRLAARKKPE